MQTTTVWTLSRILTACLRARKQDNLEIQISTDKSTSLCGLLNADVGWFLFRRFPDDPGFSSRNPAHTAADEVEEFTLANGQVDTYPRSWCFGRDKVLAALATFARTGERPNDAHWHDDSSGSD